MKTLAHLRERQGGLLRTGGIRGGPGLHQRSQLFLPDSLPHAGKVLCRCKKVPVLSKKSFLELKIHVSGLICEVGSEVQDG